MSNVTDTRNVEFFKEMDSIRAKHNIDTLEEMIAHSFFMVDGRCYSIRYNEDPKLKMCVLHSCYLAEDYNALHSTLNLEDYKITNFETYEDKCFRFDLSLK